jgi:superfamily II DNA or RNA helicase
MINIFDPKLLEGLGPHEFRRSIQRLLLQMGWECFSIDGPGDGGGDLYAENKAGERWIVQSKWRKNKSIPPTVIDEALNAFSIYDANAAVVVTNQYLSPLAKNKLRNLQETGYRIDCWNGEDLQALANKVDQFLPEKQLREYQSEAVKRIWEALTNKKRALLYMATGLGKTVVTGSIIRKIIEQNAGAKILVLAHMMVLTEQLQRALWQDIPFGYPSQLVDGSNKPVELVGLTVSTNMSILSYIKDGYVPDLIIIDECHHLGDSNNYAQILRILNSVPVLGVTATPWRGDKFSIENFFGPPSFICSIEEGMKNKYLAKVDYRLYCDNINWVDVPNLSKYSYTIKQLNKKLFLPQRDETIIERLIEAWSDVINPKCIIFCQSIEHAKNLHSLVIRFDLFKNAQLLHSEIEKNSRNLVLLNFRKSVCPMLIAVDILNEGVDVPNVNIVCFARVTHSRKIFIQQLGRGLRISPEKEKVIVLDFAADTRRLAAVRYLSEQTDEGEVEKLELRHNKITFSDLRAKKLIEEWIADAADLETANDESHLQFPAFLE